MRTYKTMVYIVVAVLLVFGFIGALLLSYRTPSHRLQEISLGDPEVNVISMFGKPHRVFYSRQDLENYCMNGGYSFHTVDGSTAHGFVPSQSSATVVVPKNGVVTNERLPKVEDKVLWYDLGFSSSAGVFYIEDGKVARVFCAGT